MTNQTHKRRTLVAWLEDKPGVLSRVTGLFSRRNFNIESLAVGHSEQAGVSRMTFVVRGTDRELNQVATQLDKLINVVGIEDVTEEPTVIREMALIKVNAPGNVRGEILQLVDIFRAHVVDVSMDAVIVQIVGPEDRVDSLIRLLDNFGILEMVRTGRVAMVRGSESHAAETVNESVLAVANGNGHLN
ncbi:MAG: acetolactate synthase small subunit [Chloroflexota bacterium]